MLVFVWRELRTGDLKAEHHRNFEQDVFEKEAISRAIGRRLELRPKYLGKIKGIIPFTVISPPEPILTFAFMLTGSMNKLPCVDGKLASCPGNS